MAIRRKTLSNQTINHIIKKKQQLLKWSCVFCKKKKDLNSMPCQTQFRRDTTHFVLINTVFTGSTICRSVYTASRLAQSTICRSVYIYCISIASIYYLQMYSALQLAPLSVDLYGLDCMALYFVQVNITSTVFTGMQILYSLTFLAGLHC